MKNQQEVEEYNYQKGLEHGKAGKYDSPPEMLGGLLNTDAELTNSARYAEGHRIGTAVRKSTE